MMKEEFRRLIEEQIDEHYRAVEQAYIACSDEIDKRKFAQIFFAQAMMWATKVVAARATVDRYIEDIKRLNDKMEQAKDILDSLSKM